jgi:hypothetical protein
MKNAQHSSEVSLSFFIAFGDGGGVQEFDYQSFFFRSDLDFSLEQLGIASWRDK